jgi:hypothetical protein
MKRTCLSPLLGAALALAPMIALTPMIACNKEQPPVPPPTPTYGVSSTGAPITSPTVYPSGTPYASATSTAAPTVPAPNTGAATGGTAQPADPAIATMAVPGLAGYAAQQAPGMAKDGNAVAGGFQTGQTLEGSFMFQPGKCYTLVAQGVGITQLDLEMQYVTPIPGLAPMAGKSSTRGSQAVIGGGNNCLRPISPFPAQAKFIVKATSGAGVAVAQLYSK